MKAIVTGAASGIGKSVSLQLAATQRGAEILITDRDATGLESVADQMRQFDGQVMTCVADITKPAECVAIVEQMEKRFGGLDALVSNAGGVRGGALAELDVETFDYSFALNTRPTWLLAKAAYNMLRKVNGAIVAVASTAAEYPTPDLGTYGASKAALVMLVRQMAVEWGHEGIRCNLVSPGPTITGITQSVYSDPEKRQERSSHIPLGRLGMPDDLADAILFLLEKRSSHITGVNLTVDGGFTSAVMVATGAGSGVTRTE